MRNSYSTAWLDARTATAAAAAAGLEPPLLMLKARWRGLSVLCGGKSTQFLIDWRDGDTVESCLSLIMSLGADWKAGGAECDAATLHCCDCHAERPLTVPL